MGPGMVGYRHVRNRSTVHEPPPASRDADRRRDRPRPRLRGPPGRQRRHRAGLGGHPRLVGDHARLVRHRSSPPGCRPGVRRAQVALTQANVEEGAWVLIYPSEGKAVSYLIAHFCRIVVDMDFVPNIFTKSVVIRSAMCQLRGNVIGNNGNRVGVVGAAKRVHIGIVRKRIIGDEWRLAVRRCPEV